MKRSTDAIYHLILLAPNHYCDDAGEYVSEEKIRRSAKNQANSVISADEQSSEQLIESFRSSNNAHLRDLAFLVTLMSTRDSFNPEQFAVVNYRFFSTQRRAEAASETQNNDTDLLNSLS